MNKAVFTKEVQDFIQENYKGLFNSEIAELVNKKFNTNFTPSQISNFKRNRQLRSGVHEMGRNYFRGKKKSEYISEEAKSRMKFNNYGKHMIGKKPHNYDEVGTIKTCSRGFVRIKVGEPSEWQYYQRYVWEQVHGAIPEGHVIFFMNGDSTDFRLENLRCIKKGHLALLNKWGLRSTESRELNEIGLNIVELITKIKDLEREG